MLALYTDRRKTMTSKRITIVCSRCGKERHPLKVRGHPSKFCQPCGSSLAVRRLKYPDAYLRFDNDESDDERLTSLERQ